MRRLVLFTAAALVLAVPRPALAETQAASSKDLALCSVWWDDGSYSLLYHIEGGKIQTAQVDGAASVTYLPNDAPNRKEFASIAGFIDSIGTKKGKRGHTKEFTKVTFSKDPQSGKQTLFIND